MTVISPSQSDSFHSGTRKPPLAPGSHVLTGHLGPLLWDPLKFLRSCSNVAPVVRMKVAGRSIYLVCDADLVREMLVNKDGAFDKGGPVYEAGRSVAPNSLVVCPAHVHREQRTLMQPAFSPRSISAAESVMADEGEHASQSWQAGQVLDVLAEAGRMTHQVVARTLMPSVTDAIDVDYLLGVVKELTRLLALQVVVPKPVRRIVPSLDRRFAVAVAGTRRAAHQILQASRDSDTPEQGLLGVLMQGDGTGGARLTEEELCDQIITLFTAGTETTAITLAWAMYVLSVRPDLERRLHAELDSLPPGPVSFKNHLGDLPFTCNFISETLRCYPSNWLLSRSPDESTVLGSYLFPAGSSIMFSPYQIHRNPQYYSDPLTFDPDRWDGRPPTVSRRAYIPFGVGARGCIGDRFAVSEIVNLLSSITRRWSLRPAHGFRIRSKRPNLFAAPYGLHLQVEGRRQQP
ncbi:cytochrome P450 [Streptomyces sp. NBC_01077]|uniref:cytochrome P450 n=1 Tax=Streptomyces sp. NBC_01077 TaxID=2903746 RepID=UPI00386F040E|nr:cytochrome P450 [Streptomyces sp. NBC_01077]WSV43785.1 cytochrome P450 [Streptomyces sp. NBC_01077]